jgi:hypothetical protein
MNSMQDWGHMPDEITFNTLLKLCMTTRDGDGADRVIYNKMIIYD